MKESIIVGILTLASLVGVIVLAVLNKDTQVLLPIVTVLIGYFVGRKRDKFVGLGRSIIKK